MSGTHAKIAALSPGRRSLRMRVRGRRRCLSCPSSAERFWAAVRLAMAEATASGAPRFRPKSDWEAKPADGTALVAPPATTSAA